MIVQSFFFILFLSASSVSMATERCVDLFLLKSENSAVDSQASFFLATGSAENSFPPELKIKSDFLNFAQGKGQAELLQHISGAYRLKQFIGASLPTFLKKAADVDEAHLIALIEVPVNWAQDTQSLAYRRAYTAITAFLQISLKKDPEIVAKNLIAEQDVQLLAHLLQSLVPSPPPKVFVLEDYPFEDKMIKRLPAILDNIFYADIWHRLIEAGIDQTFFSIPGFQISAPGVRTDPERIAIVSKKLEQKRKLNPEDKALIKFFAYRFFMAHLFSSERGRNFKELLAPFKVNRLTEIIDPIRQTFLTYKMSFSDKVRAADMFDYLYFGTALTPSAAEVNSLFLGGLQKLLHPLKKDYAQSLVDAKLAASSATTGSLPNMFAKPLDATIFKKQTVVAVVKNSVKTHGKAQTSKREVTEPSPSATDSPLTIGDLIDRPHIFSLTAESEYKVVFLRQEKAGKEANVFIFEARAVEDLESLPPRILNEILVAIQAGPTHVEYGQAGIKKLAHVKSKREGHLYEVKISSSYRAALLRVGSQWRVLAVVPRDDFAQYLRNQSWTK